MSTGIPALEKHACPACGAQAEWNPTTQKLAAITRAIVAG